MFSAKVIRIDHFVSKKGTNCAWLWVEIPGGTMPLFKILLYRPEDIAKAEAAAKSVGSIKLNIGCGSDLVARLEIA